MTAYDDSLTAIQIPLFQKAAEGSYAVGANIIWDFYPAANAPAVKIVEIDIHNALGTKPITQLACLWIDNSLCDSDLTIVIPDTGQLVAVVPRSVRYYPVLSAGTKFNVYLNSGGTGFVTKIIAVNEFIPPSETESPFFITDIAPFHVVVDNTPNVIPPFMSVWQSGNLDITVNSTTTLVPTTGELFGFDISINNHSTGAGAAFVGIQLLSNNGAKTIWFGSFSLAAGMPVQSPHLIANVSDMNFLFSNNLQFNIFATGGFTTGLANCNLRTN